MCFPLFIFCTSSDEVVISAVCASNKFKELLFVTAFCFLFLFFNFRFLFLIFHFPVFLIVKCFSPKIKRRYCRMYSTISILNPKTKTIFFCMHFDCDKIIIIIILIIALPVSLLLLTILRCTTGLQTPLAPMQLYDLLFYFGERSLAL